MGKNNNFKRFPERNPIKGRESANSATHITFFFFDSYVLVMRDVQGIIKELVNHKRK